MKFLFLTKEYPPIPDPSGQIVSVIAQQLKKEGHLVDIIARDKITHITEGEKGNIYWLKISKWERISKRVKNINCPQIIKYLYSIMSVFRKFFLAFNLRSFPNVEKKLTRKTIKLFEKHLSNNNYDMIIGFFRPYSCLEAAVKITKRTKKAKCIACYLDLVEDKSCPSFMPISLFRKLIMRGDRYIFDNCVNIMLPKASKRRNNPLYEEYYKKIVFYDFPTFLCVENESRNNNNSYDKSKIRFIFAGTLSKTHRNPIRLLELLNTLAKRNNSIIFELDFYGGGDCFELINDFLCAENFKIYIHGKIQKSNLKEIEMSSNFLINIMNNFSSLVPSKIFELFATGKPIINIMTNSDDGSMEYFNKYPAVYTYKGELTDSIIEFEEFIFSYLNYKGNLKEIKNKYITCTPEYVTWQILNLISDK